MSDGELLPDMSVQGLVLTLATVWRNLHEHRNFLFMFLDGDPSHSIDFRRPDSFSLREIL